MLCNQCLSPLTLYEFESCSGAVYSIPQTLSKVFWKFRIWPRCIPITWGLLQIIFIPWLTTLKKTREDSPTSNFHTTLFQNSFVLNEINRTTTGACYDLFYPSTDNSKNHKGGISNVKFEYNLFKIVLYWCLALFCHNVGTPLKHKP
jgi:hypothetical protein